MADGEYSGPVEAREMIELLGTLEGEVELYQSGDFTLGGTFSPATAAEYLEGVIEGEAEGEATPWDDYPEDGLLDPESLEPWENGDSYSGRLKLEEGPGEDKFRYRFDFKAIDGASEEFDISIIGEENYEDTTPDVEGAHISKAFTEAGL